MHKPNRPFPPQLALVLGFIRAIETEVRQYPEGKRGKQMLAPMDGGNSLENENNKAGQTQKAEMVEALAERVCL